MTDKSLMGNMALNKALSKWTTYNTPPREMSAFVDGFSAASAPLLARIEEMEKQIATSPDAEQNRLDAERYQKIVNYPNFLDDLFDCCCEKTDYDKLLDSMPAIAQAKVRK